MSGHRERSLRVGPDLTAKQSPEADGKLPRLLVAASHLRRSTRSTPVACQNPGAASTHRNSYHIS
jgi:hypothetical protein